MTLPRMTYREQFRLDTLLKGTAEVCYLWIEPVALGQFPDRCAIVPTNAETSQPTIPTMLSPQRSGPYCVYTKRKMPDISIFTHELEN